MQGTESTSETTASAVDALDEKAKKTVADYVGDMVALEAHIEEALDRQLQVTKDIPVAHQAVQRFHDGVKASRDAMKEYQEQIGTTGPKPIVQAGSALLGKAAGLIDKIRTEGVTKSLRDDYTAFNHAAISYTLLHATALALGDQRTAELAERGLTTYAGMVQEINHVIGEAAIEELRKDEHRIADPKAVATNRATVDRIWKKTAKNGKTGKATAAA
jgi:ferritin-like metal-binding protein YciE